MKQLKDYSIKELSNKVYDLINITSVEIGHKTDARTMVTLAKIFANDLIKENRFKNLYLQEVREAFRIGVRFGKDEPFLNIRTFYKWLYEHKKKIDDAYYQVNTLNKKPEEVPYYNKNLKLLK